MDLLPSVDNRSKSLTLLLPSRTIWVLDAKSEKSLEQAPGQRCLHASSGTLWHAAPRRYLGARALVPTTWSSKHSMEYAHNRLLAGQPSFLGCRRPFSGAPWGEKYRISSCRRSQPNQSRAPVYRCGRAWQACQSVAKRASGMLFTYIVPYELRLSHQRRVVCSP